MTNRSNNWLKLIGYCLSELSKYDVKVIFTQQPYIKMESEGISVRGYWDDSNKQNVKLYCTISDNETDWVPIFAHEFNHFIQWKKKLKVWRNANNVYETDMYNIMHNKHISSRRLIRCLNTTRDLELDCEKRTVKLLCKYKVPINIKEYIRTANIYIHFYNYAKIYRSWFPNNNPPYDNYKIRRSTSTSFYPTYNSIPESLEKMFLKYYPKANA